MLTGFQLRAAIGILKIRITELSKILGIHRFTISKLQHTPDTVYLQCHTNTLITLEKFFKENGILFLDKYSISLELKKSNNLVDRKLTVFQLRASRAALNLTLVQFSKLSNFSKSVLSNLEQGSIYDYVKNDFVDTNILKEYFIKNSLSFPDNFTVRVDK